MTSPRKPTAEFWNDFVLPALHHVLGIVRPLDPFRWSSSVRHLATAEGWAPPMLMIATAMLVGFAGRGSGLLGAHPVVKAFNYAALATWLLVAGFASLLVTWQSLRNLTRLGLAGCSRPRWWFELSRICWIAFVFLSLSVALAFFGHFANDRLPTRALTLAVPALLAGFLLFASTGYALSLSGGRPRHGRAFECVQYFYWSLIGGLIAFIPIWAAYRFGGVNGALLAAVSVALAAIIGALTIQVLQQSKRRSAW